MVVTIRVKTSNLCDFYNSDYVKYSRERYMNSLFKADGVERLRPKIIRFNQP
jgi:hypothetical protein